MTRTIDHARGCHLSSVSSHYGSRRFVRTIGPRGAFALHNGCIATLALTKEPLAMFDYLRILLNARLARMDARGASAVEYGLLIAGITALIVLIVYAFGGVLSNVYKSTCDSVGSSANAGSC
jgi:pilus assembly protein Flp/PilA